jgi:isopentenyl-diphosphate Delta-isomerase
MVGVRINKQIVNGYRQVSHLPKIKLNYFPFVYKAYLYTYMSVLIEQIDHVVLVNEQDEPQGLMEKMEAHEKGLLHRAFSVFLVNDKHELLLQQRNINKYHSGGLLTNTCCSHQKNNETTLEASARRCIEEIGFAVPMETAFQFIYKAQLDNELTEHELDHVVFGKCNTIDAPFNEEEVSALFFEPLTMLEKDVVENPEKYTAWFIIALPMFIKWYNQHQIN